MSEIIKNDGLTSNPWQKLREYTPARLALGRCGVSLPTQEHLAFQMSHAMARDAVHTALDFEALKERILKIGDSNLKEIFLLKSQAKDRQEYLKRPDKGRLLGHESLKTLSLFAKGQTQKFDVALVLGDGLSARAIETNAIPFLQELLPLLAKRNYNLAPLTLVEQCRVGCGDHIGHTLRASVVAILIGERPGLSSPDSMGIYMTLNPEPGVTTDNQRNCISNIRPQGMSWLHGASKLDYLIDRANRFQLSGVNLKDEQRAEDLPLESKLTYLA